MSWTKGLGLCHFLLCTQDQKTAHASRERYLIFAEYLSLFPDEDTDASKG